MNYLITTKSHATSDIHSLKLMVHLSKMLITWKSLPMFLINGSSWLGLELHKITMKRASILMSMSMLSTFRSRMFGICSECVWRRQIVGTALGQSLILFAIIYFAYLSNSWEKSIKFVKTRRNFEELMALGATNLVELCSSWVYSSIGFGSLWKIVSSDSCTAQSRKKLWSQVSIDEFKRACSVLLS